MQMPALMTLAAEAAQHAATRQAHASRNVANADTPGYRPTDLTPFTVKVAPAPARATRAGHMFDPQKAAWSIERPKTASDPNGNGVDLETEILRATDAQRSHSRALNVYQASLDILRASIGRSR